MKVCLSDDGLHHYISNGAGFVLCVACYAEITVAGLTSRWVKA